MSTAALLDWLRRGPRFLRASDAWLLTPPGAVGSVLRALSTRPREPCAPAGPPPERELDFIAWASELFSALGRHYFRWQVRGLEHVPAQGPVLLVGNHNGGVIPTDTLLTLAALVERWGPEGAPQVLVHDFVLAEPTLGRLARGLGMLRACHEEAERALRAGRRVLVYPGADQDNFRTFGERHRVVLGGRMGFVRLALRLGVPVVPVVSAGTHEQLVILARGEAAARWLGLERRLRLRSFPLALSLPWGLTSGLLPYLPLPAQTTLAFGAPVRWPHLGAEAAGAPETVRRCYQQVEARMQALLDGLYAGRRGLLGQARPRPR